MYSTYVNRNGKRVTSHTAVVDKYISNTGRWRRRINICKAAKC